MAVYALTGATGFIGQVLTQHLISAGHQVRALVRSPQSPQDNAITFVEGALENKASLSQLLEGANFVIHLAGSVAAFNRRGFFKTNAAGTTHLIEAMEQAQPHVPLIAISSLAARHPELSDYAASKRAGEDIIRSSSLPWSILRPPAVHGPHDMAMRPLWKLMQQGWLPRFSDPQARFSLLHVQDLAEALAAVLDQFDLCQGQILELDDQYNNESMPGYGWRDLNAIGEAVFQRRIREVAIPKPLLLSAAGLADVFSWISRSPNVFTVGKVHELCYPSWVVDYSEAWTKLGWSPRRQLRDTLLTLA